MLPDEFFPDWSPDGRKLLFSRSADDGTVAIVAMESERRRPGTVTVGYGVAMAMAINEQVALLPRIRDPRRDRLRRPLLQRLQR